MKEVICVIPARVASKRFPNKVLCCFKDKPILEWVWISANKCEIFKEIVFAIDDYKTADLIKGFGGKYFMTSKDCNCGTDRFVELVVNKKIDGDIFVNWQADAPFIKKEMVEDLLKKNSFDKSGICTLKKNINNKKDIDNPNIVKVITNKDNFAIYFSRFPIPFNGTKFYKHIGIYAYTKSSLEKIKNMQVSFLEKSEKLEQLRFLENGFSIKVNETIFDSVSIDCEKDLLVLV